MPRPSGPPPDPNRARRNKDPRAGADGDWQVIEPTPNDQPIPEIPSWVDATDRTREVYYFLAGLPQAKIWQPGEWFQLWMTLPLLERYFCKPGSEGLKAIMALLNGGLHLTIEDLHRARIKMADAVTEPELEESDRKKVVDLEERKKRIVGGANG